MKTKRFLSILVSLVLVLGMFPGMSLTASAAGNTTEITPTNTNGTMRITLIIDPTVTAPTAKTLTYNGQKQELVNAGSTEDGTLYYAVTTENKAPTDESLYTTSIPTATDAGTYYVWYKAVGDGNETTPLCVAATIAASDNNTGNNTNTDSSSATVSEAKVDGMDALAKKEAQTGATYQLEIKDADVNSTGGSTIAGYAAKMYEEAKDTYKTEFLDFSILKIPNGGTKDQAELIHDPDVVMDVSFVYGLDGKYNPMIWRYHGTDAAAFTELTEAPAAADRKDGFFFVENKASNPAAAVFHVYTSGFSTYALTYSPTPITLNTNYRPAAPVVPAAGGGGGSSSSGPNWIGIGPNGAGMSSPIGNTLSAGATPAGGTVTATDAQVTAAGVPDASGTPAVGGKSNPKSNPTEVTVTNGKTNPSTNEIAPKMGDPMDDVVPILYILAMSGLLLLHRPRRYAL